MDRGEVTAVLQDAGIEVREGGHKGSTWLEFVVDDTDGTVYFDDAAVVTQVLLITEGVSEQTIADARERLGFADEPPATVRETRSLSWWNDEVAMGVELHVDDDDRSVTRTTQGWRSRFADGTGVTGAFADVSGDGVLDIGMADTALEPALTGAGFERIGPVALPIANAPLAGRRVTAWRRTDVDVERRLETSVFGHEDGELSSFTIEYDWQSSEAASHWIDALETTYGAPMSRTTDTHRRWTRVVDGVERELAVRVQDDGRVTRTIFEQHRPVRE